MIVQADIVYKDELVTAFIGSFFVGDNHGHPIIVPNKHYENLYDLPDAETKQIMLVSKLVAKALKKSHKCDGVMVRQNNEPASAQHAFHYHMHLIPRYDGDKLDTEVPASRKSTPEERLPYANRLRDEIEKLRD